MSREDGPAPRIMGIVNVTPDSFSDGGRYLDPAQAIEHARELVEAGADILDVGAESTRPGAKPVDEEEEWRRLEPVLQGLLSAGLGCSLSIDTRKPSLMLRAAALGVTYVNDVSGLAPDPVLAKLAAFPELQYIAMHMQGTPETMQRDPLHGEAAVSAVDEFFARAASRLVAAGFSAGRIWLDPGIGFGKSDSGNVRLLAALPRWANRYRLAVGVSRKGFIGRALDLSRPEERDKPTKMLELGLAMLGVGMIRTHDVASLRRLIDLLGAGH